MTSPEAQPRESELVRFMSKFTKGSAESCWEWEAALSGTGYGQFENKLDPAKAAHRYALIINVGPPPVGRNLALHSCDNRACVNPSHLSWGSHQDNSDDAKARGRIPRGVDRPNAVITEERAREIKTRLAAGDTVATLAAELGFKYSTVNSIRRGKSWRHVA